MRLIQWLRIFTLAITVCGSQGLAASTFCVATNGSSHYPYASWDDAATNIQTAVDVATNDGDVVVITNGVYTGSGTYVVSVTNRAGRALTIQGQGAELTVIDGQGARVGVYLDSTTTNVIIEKLSVTRGFRGGTGTLTTHGGGGIMMSNGTVRLCAIQNNTNSTTSSYAIGGGIFMAGGLVSQCVIVSNVASMTGTREARGAGICVTGGTVERCLIAGNSLVSGKSVPCYGGGVYVSGGTVRNCLVVRNTAAPAYAEDNNLSACAGVYLGGSGKVLNCTIARNAMLAGHGVGMLMVGGSVTNSIVYHNTLTQNPADVFPVEANVFMTGGSFAYSCSTPLMPGTNNIAGDPLFADAEVDDYRLLPGSPCLDAGTNILPTVSVDYDGNVRPQDGNGDTIARHDMGAYEAEPINAGVLRCGFAAPTNTSLEALNAVFTATVAGTETNGLTYWWDFTADGTNDIGGEAATSVSNRYGYGSYAVRLTVSNDQGLAATCLRGAYVKVAPAVVYVGAGGNSDTAPYEEPAKAASNLQAAINWSLAMETTGTVVSVSNGTYRIGDQVLLSKGVTVRGSGGAANTVLLQTNLQGRVLYITDGAAGAVVEDLTLTGGKAVSGALIGATSYGAGLRMHAGTVRNCVISNNASSVRDADGGGVYMAGGTLLNCRVVNNSAQGTYNGEGFGGGIYMDTGCVERCVVMSNTISTTASGSSYGNLYGAGVYMAKGLLQNTLISGNMATNGDPNKASATRGGGLFLASGTAVNCTIADNSLNPVGMGGGYYGAGAVTNAIVYFNLVGAGADNTVTNGGTFCFACTTPAIAGPGNISDDPQFINHTNGNYRLAAGSPCIDKGTNLVSVTNDLDGAVRPQQGQTALAHDMGAYEAGPSSGAFELLFYGTPLEGVAPWNVVFTATVSGLHTNAVYYWWDFDGNGSPDASGLGLSVATNTYYAAGRYSVGVVASNEVAEVTNAMQATYVHVAAPIVYVATNGTHSLPFDTPATAATNIQAAVDEAVVMATATTRVQILPGTYDISQEIAVNKGITILGAGGAGRTIVRRSPAGTYARVWFVNHAAAVLDGVTIRDGLSTTLGVDGIGLWLQNGTVQNCIIVSNTTTARGASGGGVRMDAGTLRSCLVAGNEASANSYSDPGMGGGIYLLGGRVENCTITGNRVNAVNTNALGGGVYRSGGGLTNCIVYGNLAKTSHSNLYAAAGVGFSCSPDLLHDPAGTGNITNHPGFITPSSGYGVGYTPGDCRLKADSPCLNAGTNRTWMSGATDLTGVKRIVDGRVDMGAYERPPPVGTAVVVH